MNEKAHKGAANVAAVAGSHPSVLIVVGTTLLFLGAAIALVMARSPYTDKGWSGKMQRCALWAAYAGAFLEFLGVLEGLGPDQKPLQMAMLVPALLTLGFVAISWPVLLVPGLRREHGSLRRWAGSALADLFTRREQDGVEHRPGTESNGRALSVGDVESDSHSAASPKRGADDGARAHAPAPQATES